ncbi:hypothetical protein COBT_003698, partial [Conglomerata obtusa]
MLNIIYLLASIYTTLFDSPIQNYGKTFQNSEIGCLYNDLIDIHKYVIYNKHKTIAVINTEVQCNNKTELAPLMKYTETLRLLKSILNHINDLKIIQNWHCMDIKYVIPNSYYRKLMNTINMYNFFNDIHINLSRNNLSQINLPTKNEQNLFFRSIKKNKKPLKDKLLQLQRELEKIINLIKLELSKIIKNPEHTLKEFIKLLKTIDDTFIDYKNESCEANNNGIIKYEDYSFFNEGNENFQNLQISNLKLMNNIFTANYFRHNANLITIKFVLDNQ